METTTLTRAERRKIRRERRQTKNGSQLPTAPLPFRAPSIRPLTDNQCLLFDAYDNGQHIMAMGTAGTGKTFVTLALGLQDVLEGEQLDGVTIIRSTEPVKDQGFLPGSIKEKQRVYEAPYHALCDELFCRGDAYDLLKHRGLIDFESTSYLRGRTFRNRFILVDEMQNMTAAECHTVMTRVGENCKVAFCGDLRQNDLVKGKGTSGLHDFMKVVERMSSFKTIVFGPDDIVRSGLIKEYILTREALEDEGAVRPLG